MNLLLQTRCMLLFLLLGTAWGFHVRIRQTSATRAVRPINHPAKLQFLLPSLHQPREKYPDSSLLKAEPVSAKERESDASSMDDDASS
jgi:hypothetical protein